MQKNIADTTDLASTTINHHPSFLQSPQNGLCAQNVDVLMFPCTKACAGLGALGRELWDPHPCRLLPRRGTGRRWSSRGSLQVDGRKDSGEVDIGSKCPGS